MPTTGSYQFITKDGNLSPPRSISRDSFHSDFSYGDILRGPDFPLTAKVTSDFYLFGQERPRIRALKNTLNYYTYLSNYYTYLSGAAGDRSQQTMRCLNIPSIFYGKTIKKGTVSCKWYLTGTLMAELRDENRNGELIQTVGSTGSGSVGGVVLYNEGFIILHGNWDLHPSYTDEFNFYDPGVTTYAPKWIYYFGTGSSGVSLTPSSSFSLDFDGVEEIPTITLLANAERGEMNHSNNPTFIEYGQSMTAVSGSDAYVEKDELELKNIVKAPYDEVEPRFEKTVFISKIGIYDEKKNLIAIAKTSSPIRKKENESIGFKLKIDI